MTNHEQMENSQSVNAPSEFIIAGFWRRLAAGFIDLFMLAIMQGILMSLIEIADVHQYNMLGILIFVTRVFVFLFYFPIMEGTSLNASVGKLILGIKVSDEEGNRITFLRALGRNSVKIAYFFAIPWVFFVGTLMTTAHSITVFVPFLAVAPHARVMFKMGIHSITVFVPFLAVTFAVFLSGVLMIALTSNRRCLHDFAARTIVVRT